MIPILYPIDQKIFAGNGIGMLSDAISCECTEKLNDKYEVEMVLPRNGLHTSEISTDCVIKVKPNYEDPPQLFRIYSVEKDYSDVVSVKAAHISYDTAGIPIYPFVATNLDDAVDNLNENRCVLSESPFLLNCEFSAKGKLDVAVPTSFRSLLGGSDNSIASVYGGEYHYDNYIINLVEERGIDRGICFVYGKNISDFEQEMNTENLYTAVWGYWRKSINNTDNVVYGNIIECDGDFPYDKIYILDTSNMIKTTGDTLASADQINSQVEEYIKKNSVGIPKTKMKIDYTDDSNIINVCLGDRVGVMYPEYNIYAIARCNTVVFDCLDEKNKSIEIGVNADDISDTISNLIKKTV